MKKYLRLSAEAARNSYSPYSRFRVGAVLLCADNSFFKGTNVENRSFGLTICAERSALSAAVVGGKHDFKALFLVCLDAEYPVPPCGACRQILSEFTDPCFNVYYSGKDFKFIHHTLGELYPFDSLHELKKQY
ncbi:MAG: cytidine deaminase [Spirochaetales bacterium]|nr:cytidine deaminase [Spirochaetales bacterium]